MATVKHTPGPWEFDGFEMVIAIGLIAPFRIAHKDGADVITGTRTWEANARLIAAAPDLLAALHQAKEWLEGWGSAESELAFIEAAIAKAEGRS